MYGLQAFKNKICDLKFTLKIAGRYLFSKKSHNAINVISGISAAGVAVGTLALVVVLSVFNGFGELTSQLFSVFDPEIRITAKVGKTFRTTDRGIEQLKKHEKIAVFTEVIEENALVRYREKQMPITVKGVTDNFNKLTSIDSILFDGSFQLYDGAFERVVTGIGIASSLGLGAHFVDPILLYAPKKTAKINLLQPENSFVQTMSFASGIFQTQQAQFDEKYMIISINHARQLFELEEKTVTAIEIKFKNGTDIPTVQQEIKRIVGENFDVKNRFEQQETFFHIMRLEKWITFLILAFILLIASFNIIGSLSMLIIEKKEAIQTLSFLGASKKNIRQIFLLEGWLISAMGAFIGVFLGTGICWLQEKYGIIRLGEGYIVDVYPVAIHPSDIALILLTVLAMGFLAAIYPVRYIK